MVGLLDISIDAQKAKVTIQGQDVDVRGITATHIAKLLVKFEALQQLMDGKTMSAREFVTLAPEAVAALIAYGTGYDDNDDPLKFEMATTKATMLSAGEQIDLVTGIAKATFGDRLDPFVKGLTERFAKVGEAVENAGKDQATRSPARSRDSLVSATTPEMFGATHQGNLQASPS